MNHVEGEGLENNNIFRIEFMPNGHMMLSLWRKGLQIYDPDNQTFKSYFPGGIGKESGITNYSINDFEPAGDGRYWIGGHSGLELFDPQTETFQRVDLPYFEGIFDLHLDDKGQLWVASSAGLIRYLPEQDTHTVYMDSDGLADNFVASIEEDELGYLWLGTRNGLNRFNPRNETFTTYDVRDGLAGSQLNRYSHLQTRAGLMYFGGSDGLTIFDPKQLPTNTTQPYIVLTRLELAQQVATPRNSEYLNADINQLDSLVLPYHQRDVAFEFAALNFISPQKNLYRYRLTGLESNWNHVDSGRRFVRYTNLNPGNYVFEVYGSNNDDLWSQQPKRLQLTVLPAWWQTWWARLLQLVAGALTIYAIVYWKVRQNKQRQAELQELVRNKTVELAGANESVRQLNAELEQRVIQRTQELSVEVEERRSAEAKLFHMAFHDPLTGLPNRPWLLQQLEHAIDHAQRSDSAYGLLFLDGDRFKKVNDTHGHLLGDSLLLDAANRLKALLPEECTAVRLGGDEFTVLVREVESEQQLIDIAELIVRKFEQPFLIDQLQVFFRVSVGMVHCKRQYAKPEEVLRDADIAMYKAKEKGRGTYQVFDGHMREQEVAMAALEVDLYQALELGQFKAAYQPIVCLESQRLVSFELLMRWQHPTLGMVPPDKFIPLAEETGQIFDMGLWVFEQACQQLQQWRELVDEHRLPTIAVNLSAVQLNQPNLIDKLDVILARTGTKGRHLKLEITETALMENTQAVNEILGSLRERHIELAIDDFGTGYSSLSYLDQLPVQVLKIDRSFVNSLIDRGEEHEGTQEIVKATISLAHSLKVKVVAEGIETEDQWRTLHGYHCDFGQGYLFAKPMWPDQATEYLLDNLDRHQPQVQQLRP